MIRPRVICFELITFHLRNFSPSFCFYIFLTMSSCITVLLLVNDCVFLGLPLQRKSVGVLINGSEGEEYNGCTLSLEF